MVLVTYHDWRRMSGRAPGAGVRVIDCALASMGMEAARLKEGQRSPSVNGSLGAAVNACRLRKMKMVAADGSAGRK